MKRHIITSLALPGLLLYCGCNEKRELNEKIVHRNINGEITRIEFRGHVSQAELHDLTSIATLRRLDLSYTSFENPSIEFVKPLNLIPDYSPLQ